MSDVLVLSLFSISYLTAGIVLLSSLLSPRIRATASGATSSFPLLPVFRLIFAPFVLLLLLSSIGVSLGKYLVTGTAQRRQQVISRSEAEERAEKPYQPFDEEWEERLNAETERRKNLEVREKEFNGIIGFFHPFCHAGGGGERVLWAAIKAVQTKYPKAICVVYTGDHEASKEDILRRAKNRFNIELYAARIHFLYLSTRRLVLASTWPYFTLAGQSLGSLLLLLDAFTLLVPDIFIDTMGYGFVLAGAKWLVPSLPIGAYVHYPTISTDMLASLDETETSGKGSNGQILGSREEKRRAVGNRGLNAGTGRGWKGKLKKIYWQAFAWAYSWAGGNVDVVMTNSTWTQDHIKELWGKARQRQRREGEIEVVFPPCAVKELEGKIDVSKESEEKREKLLLYIAQFRPEKNHELMLHAFAEMLEDDAKGKGLSDARLVLVGSVRDDEDSKLVYKLRLLANELNINKQVDFVCNASWTEILGFLQKSSVGINGMWNEHFGIGVVEYQAAGLISVVNDSGGPKLDIAVPHNGGVTGFHASTVADYAAGFAKALSIPKSEVVETRLRARASAQRFSEEAFEKQWLVHLGRLIHMQVHPPREETTFDQWLLVGIFSTLIAGDLNTLFGPYVLSLMRMVGGTA